MMRIIFFPVLFLLLPFTAREQTRVLLPRIKTIYYKLGEDYVQIKVYQYGEAKDLFFINLHDNEITAVSGARRILETNGGTLVRIENENQRNMRFLLNGKHYAFDPNRIFSRAGIIQTLNTFGLISARAIDELEKFAARLEELLPPPPTCVIALHNNSDGEFSIISYMSGHEREKDAKAIYVKSLQDPDDLFLTTDSSFFMFLTRERFNVVLQDNINAKQDGSLSVYCGERNIRYINCETEHGKTTQYHTMIMAATRYIKSYLPEIGLYNFQLFPNPDSVSLSSPCGIWFGEKKVGETKLKPTSAGNRSFSGQIQMLKTFPLYDNMDMFYYPARGAKTAKIDLRIDPTRPKKLYNPYKAIIPIKVMR